MRKLAIAVCYFYPEKEYLQNDACIPIQVGYGETHIDMGIQKDNEGDNRGCKHPYYSELSGLYWLWKNIDAEYKGLFHHRRALTLKKESFSSNLYFLYRRVRCTIATLFKNKEFVRPYELYVPELIYKREVNSFLSILNEKYLETIDIIVPKPYEFWPMSVMRYFSSVIDYCTFELLGKIIKDYWPQYHEYWYKTINSRKLYYANISIMRNSLFDSYVTFVFGVLDKLEEKFKEQNYYISFTDEKAMSRKFGYISELLTNVFILYQCERGVKIKELFIIINNNANYWK